MALYLIETQLDQSRPDGPSVLSERIADAVERAGGEVIEIQVGRATRHLYVIAEHEAPAELEAALHQADIAANGIAEVRLVGPSLEEIKAQRAGARYLVEWDLPAGLTMERYLARKRDKAPGYAQVPETTFLRTYVCVDLSKCLCLYDAPDEAAVLRAREAVETPVDRLTAIEEASRVRA